MGTPSNSQKINSTSRLSMSWICYDCKQMAQKFILFLQLNCLRCGILTDFITIIPKSMFLVPGLVMTSPRQKIKSNFALSHQTDVVFIWMQEMRELLVFVVFRFPQMAHLGLPDMMSTWYQSIPFGQLPLRAHFLLKVRLPILLCSHSFGHQAILLPFQLLRI